MPLVISRNDIRRIKADAIVCPTDSSFSGSGGTDELIHELSGKRLDERCAKIGHLSVGDAVVTDAYDFENASYIIHTCEPVYKDGLHNENELLASCYRKSLELADSLHLESIAFPLISSGTFAFPKGEALRIATDTITGFLLEHEMQVYLLVYSKDAFDTASRLYTDIHDYLDGILAPVQYDNAAKPSQSLSTVSYRPKRKKAQSVEPESKIESSFIYHEIKTSHKEAEMESMDLYAFATDARFEPDESFSECLIRMIDERGLTDPEVYKKANIDRKHFNHIKNNKDYRPKKETVAALAIGMKLNQKDTDTLMERAGFVLSQSFKFDLIIRYCIENKIYDIFRINEILFEQDQKILGC
ncbi:MAG: macro domain-containing protein [Erysipelotrichaceae bacterium]|nr:macro domain-containing protein [Erysipelotrichaceae bacterium]